MQDERPACERAPDAICQNGLQEFLSPFVVLGLPLIMLALTWWLILRFQRQLRAGRWRSALVTIVSGYGALIAVAYGSFAILFATAVGWGQFAIAYALIVGVGLFVYTPGWLLTLLAFTLARNRAT